MQRFMGQVQPARIKMCTDCGAHCRIILPDGTQTEDIFTLNHARTLLLGLCNEGHLTLEEAAELFDEIDCEFSYVQTFIDLLFNTPFGLKVRMFKRPPKALICNN